jgi:putative ABC transport system permease protein
LSLFGGLIGVIVGFTVATVVGRFASFQPIVSISSILLAFGVSFTIGVFFGFYPAQRAAALDPIDALRYE